MAIDRSYLTDLLLGALEPEGFENEQWFVGDHEKPPEGGWQGQEGQSDWVSYIVLTSTPSQQPTGDIGTTGSDVWFGYALTTVSLSRRAAEKNAAFARERLEEIQRQKTDDGRTISKVQVVRYGGCERLTLEPPLYLITDQVTIYTTR